MRNLVFAAILILIPAVCLAQIRFARAVGSAYWEGGSSVVQTSDGGYAVAGTYASKLFLVKFSSSGSVEWSRAVGGTSDDYGSSVVQTSDGGFAVAGMTASFGAGYEDLFLVKFTSTGSVEWSRAVGGTGYDNGRSVVQTSDGGYVVVGETEFGAGYQDFFVVKFSSSGSVEWSRAVGRTNTDEGYSVVRTSDGGFIVAGSGSFSGSYGLSLVKFSSSGSVEWSCAPIGGLDAGEGYSVVQTSDGGFVVAGRTYLTGLGYDLFLVKFSSTGLLEWSRAVGGTDNDYGYSVVQTSDGGFAVAGETESYGAGDYDLFLVKFSSTGTVEWSRAVGGTNADWGKSVVQTNDSGLAVAGVTESYGAGESDLFLVKFDAEGNSCVGASIFPTTTDVSPSIYSSWPTVTTVSPTVATISPTVTNISPTVTEICTDDIVETIIKPKKIEITAFPNPFNSSCAISAPPNATIEIFDINGKRISQLPQGTTIWTPAKEIGSGIYFVKATKKDGQTAIKRIVLLK